MASRMKGISFLRHIFMPRWIYVAAPPIPSPSHFSTLFSTLEEKNIPPLHSPFSDFAATRFNLSSADIARMLKKVPSLDKRKTLQNVERVVHLLTKNGCTDHHIARIMRSEPLVLRVNAEKLLQPKIELLKDIGIDEKELLNVLIKAPQVLCNSLQDSLLAKITFLKNFFQSQNLFLRALKGSPYILTYSLEKGLRPSLAFWEGCGFQREELLRFLSSKPSLLRKPTMTPPKVDLIRKIGICKESNMYKNVLSVVAMARVETLESKMDNLRKWGLSAEEVWELFRTAPVVFNLSEDNVRKKMEFVVRTMELPPNYVVKHSAFLRHSLAKVIRPRFVVFQHMKSLNGIEDLKSKQLHAVIRMPKAHFVNTILKGHPESETLYALHEKAILNV